MKLTPADYAALLLILVVALYVGIVNGHYTYDDAFITYRMAENLANGLGFVYNANEWHLGSTAAFYGLILAGFGWIFGGAAIPAIGGVISSLSVLATGWILYGFGRGMERADAALCGLLAALFYVANPMIFVTFGGEMPFLLALVTGAFYAHQRTRRLETRGSVSAPAIGGPNAAAGNARLMATLFNVRFTATLLAVLAMLTRPDGVLAALVLFAWDIVSRRRVLWRELLVGAIVLLPFVALAWYAYGSPLPSTLGAKLAQRDSGLWPTFGHGLVDWVRLFVWNDRGPNLGFAPVAPPTLWLWMLVGVAAVWRYRAFWPVLAYAGVFVLGYALLRVPFYHWYAAPAALALSILAACGLSAVAELIVRIWKGGDRRAVYAGIIAVACLISAPALAALPRTSALNDTVKLYIEAGHWLEANTPPSHSVGYYEIGYIGFYGHRRMVDALGLIDPSLSPAVARRDFAFAFRQARPDYILEKRGAGLNAFLNEPWFKEEYHPRATLSLRPGASEALIVHERISPAPPPSSSPPATPPPASPR